MGSLLSKIADEHRDFENWCEKRGYAYPNREYWKHEKYQEYEDYLDPPEEREKREREHKERMESQRDKVGVLDLGWWYNSDKSNEKCPKCENKLLRKPGWLLTDEYGCPKCGHTEGGEW